MCAWWLTNLINFQKSHTKGVFLYMKINMEFLKGDNIKPIAMAMVLKFHVSSGFIINYSNAKVAELTRLDRRTAKKYTKHLLDNNMAEMVNGGLLLKKLYSNNKFWRNARLSGDISENIMYLNFLLVKHEIKKQEYVIEKKEASLTVNNLKQMRSSMNSLKRVKSGDKVLDKDVHLSLDRLSSILNLSRNKTNSMIKEMSSKGLISKSNNIKFICKSNKYSYLMPNTFVHKGNVYSYACNSYCLLSRV